MIYAAIAAAMVAVAGWVAAYRARGESRDALQGANAAAERARMAEIATGAQKGRAELAEQRLAAAQSEAIGNAAVLLATAQTLRAERADRIVAYEKLAALGAPVGPVVLDAALARLHAHGDSPGTGAAPGASPGGGERGQVSDHHPGVAPAKPGPGGSGGV